MNDTNSPESRAKRNIPPAAVAVAVAIAFVLALLQPAQADTAITVPTVPDNLKVDVGNKVFLVGHARGTQNYICLPSGSGFAFSLFTPEATLFDDKGEQIITHFFSPDPSLDPAEKGMIRATWVDSRDTSSVWAKLAPDGASTDLKFVEKGAVAWLLLNVPNTQDGPTGGDRLSETKQVQRLNTSGGVAPSTGCSVSTDVGTRAFMPYTADYFFYR